MFGQLEKNINSVLIDFEAYDNDLVTSEDVIFLHECFDFNEIHGVFCYYGLFDGDCLSADFVQFPS